MVSLDSPRTVHRSPGGCWERGEEEPGEAKNWEETHTAALGARAGESSLDWSVGCEELVTGPKEGAERALVFVPRGGQTISVLVSDLIAGKEASGP